MKEEENETTHRESHECHMIYNNNEPAQTCALCVTVEDEDQQYTGKRKREKRREGEREREGRETKECTQI